ncbi:alpha/beta hydrolase family protein [Rubripirellula reticaptiva]|uniref:Alpha/beta hydrolase family protein n=1 Tax=Rubripirellula reticaptiva TaxID=2528013 RepID=A0A5C6F9Y6_9BACT|nr:prolyl oligopeptidase family serine peptidase [Rubripirellula reticaptiva]TWU57297.1 Alpha/beta hydrolase family protein [Rubripirellula reticaptiva]
MSSRKLIAPSLLGLVFIAVWNLTSMADDQTGSETLAGDRLVREYFEIQTEQLSKQVLPPDTTLQQWKDGRPELQRQLRDMLGLDPMPPRTSLQAEVVGSMLHGDYRVERLHFQPSPGLYVAANFYLPAKVETRLPTILYGCGHAKQAAGKLSYGNKTAYHHHGVWFARNGYACLIIDTIQWGEFLGDHHGTYRLKQWWWNNRGYTPAGVEAWTCVRALDYLETRPEVDSDRFGVTGRSGGGAYSWWVTGIDDRVKVAVPVAGITTLRNHVVDGCVEGHCDCMYMINTYRWDYSMVAAMAAPRPLLIANSDKDTIFPLDGVLAIHQQVRDVYRLYGQDDKLGLQITEGPHRDTQELRVHAFRWFNRWLKDDDSLIQFPAEKTLTPEELKVFDELPADQTVTTIQESFVPKVDAGELPSTDEALLKRTEQWVNDLNTKTFAGWPDASQPIPLNTAHSETLRNDSVQCQVYDFDSQRPYRLPFYVLRPRDAVEKPKSVHLVVLHAEDWTAIENDLKTLASTAPPVDSKANSQAGHTGSTPTLSELVESNPDAAVLLFAPRGVGSTRWTGDDRSADHLLRRFMLLGQTADGMRIWDIRRCLGAMGDVPELSGLPVTATGRSTAAAWLLYASLQSPILAKPNVAKLSLVDLPTTNRDAISLLNVSRVIEIPQAVLAATTKVQSVELVSSRSGDSDWQAIADASNRFATSVNIKRSTD